MSYHHIWSNDQRQQAANAGAKSGGAYTGWRPRPSLPRWPFIIPLAACMASLVWRAFT